MSPIHLSREVRIRGLGSAMFSHNNPSLHTRLETVFIDDRPHHLSQTPLLLTELPHRG